MKHRIIKVAAACAALGAWAQGALAQASFPQEITVPEGAIVIYQPQPEKLVGNQLTSRAAMSLLPSGATDPVFGVFWFTANVFTGEEEGMAHVRDIRVSKAHWPDSTPAGEATFTRIVDQAAANADLAISRQRLAASLANAEREQQSLAELKNDPPKIVFADRLSVLLLYDGEPRWSEVEGSSYERVLNTPFLVVRDQRSQTCYLSSGSLWYSSGDAGGPWQPLSKPPADLAQMLPEPDADDPVPSQPPDIIVASQPTELVVSDGPPQWKPVGEGALLYVQNTETPWVRELASGQIYLLISGRWFRAANNSGPWSFVRPDQLPESFKNIPAASDIGGLRVSVAGTEEAEDAVLDAAIPTTAAIERSEAKLEVQYEGQPQFENIPGTQLAQAVNTPSQVLQIGPKYYACDDGVWFTAGDPQGPWEVADSVPEDEIEKIPPSSSAYNLTHVHIYQSTPQVVYVGYTPGYLWSFSRWGVPVYGTGWYYPPHPRYYFPRPYTFGFHVGYNPWTGWNFGVSWNVGFLRFGSRWGGGYRRPGFGCCRGWYGGYRPGWGGGFHRGRTQINIGSINIGNSVNIGNRARVSNRLRNNPKAAQLRRPSVYDQPQARNRKADRAAQRRDLQQARPSRARDNSVLADRSGNVVRKKGEKWQTREGNKWRDAPRPSNRRDVNPSPRDRAAPRIDRGNLQRDLRARQRGMQREKTQRRVPRRTPAPKRPRRR